jgi:DNA primase
LPIQPIQDYRRFGGEPSKPGQVQPRARRNSRPNAQAATRLDRAAWLLARHAELWDDLSDAVHSLLAEQALPHGPFFRAVERVLHDHGPVKLETLLADLAQAPEAEALGPLLASIQAAHALDPDPPLADLGRLIGQIEFTELSEQLKVLIQSGELTETDHAHIRALYARQAELKRQGVAT